MLDDEPFYITVNLEIALTHLRYPDQERTLWVDAICIDQTNNNERNEQVRYMREIYCHCSVDIFWLGVHHDRIKRGMEVMENLEGFDITKLRSMGWKSTPAYRGAQDQRDDWYPTEDDWWALRHLFTHSNIWKRVWVVQEISCAPRVILLAGKSVMEWDLVERILGSKDYYTDAFHSPFSHDMDTLTSGIFANAQIVKNQRRIFREMQEGGESSLLDVLARFRSTFSTDPRDKIYALLGLVSDSLGIEIDYHKSVKDVFIHVVECIINSSTNLDIICQSQWAMFDHPERNKDLPSWVPDFVSPGQGNFLFAQRSTFHAGDSICSVPCKISATGHLNLDGISLGRVTQIRGIDYGAIQRESREKRISRNYEQEKWLLVRDWMNKYLLTEEKDEGQVPEGTRSSTYATGEPKFQAFWRTVVADCKAYPTERLDASDIEHDDLIFRQIRDDQSLLERMGELKCEAMLRKMTRNWRFATSQTGFYAMVPLDAEEGDELVAVHGAKVSLVLRLIEREDEKVFRIIGGAYVHGFMDGEARIWAEEGRLQAEHLYLA